MEPEFVIKDNYHLILAPKTAGFPKPAPEATEMLAECGCKVWVAPSSVNMIESELPTQLACIDHALPAMEVYKERYPDEKIELRMAPGASEEARTGFQRALSRVIPTLTEEEYDKAVRDSR